MGEERGEEGRGREGREEERKRMRGEEGNGEEMGREDGEERRGGEMVGRGERRGGIGTNEKVPKHIELVNWGITRGRLH